MKFRINRRQIILSSAVTAVSLACPAILRAQSFPNKNITLLVGFSAGGLTDTVARLLGDYLTKELGTTVITVNKAGAAGGIALEELARADADGHTILVSSVGQIAVLPHTSPQLKVDPRTEIGHVSLIGEGDFVFTVHSSLPIHTVVELKAYMAENPDSLLYGTSGAGGNLHLATELFLELADLKMEGVHYPGSSALMPDLLNNQVQFAINVYPAVAEYIKEGMLRPILVTGSERKPDIPDVQTSIDVGMEPLSRCQNWFGLHTPAGVPAEVTALLAEKVSTAVASSALRDRLKSAGLTAKSLTPVEFSDRVVQDYQLFGDIAASANLKI